MRRVLIGVISAGLALLAYALWPHRLVALAVAFGSYALFDWLGLAPSPYSKTSSLLLPDDQQPDTTGKP